MKRQIFYSTILCTIFIVFSSFITIDNNPEPDLILSGCGEGYTEVSWSVECPNGITYTGSRCFREEHAAQATLQILGAPCPPN